MPHRPLLEACVGSVDDAIAAEQAGADRLELCSALELGGLTPSIGLAEHVLGAVAIPVVTMLRPRAGGFAYSEHEFACLVADAERLLAARAGGIAFGFLTTSGILHTDRIATLVRLADDQETVFHKAFDALDDQATALETLIDLGVTRVLTSGGAASADLGSGRLRSLVELAAGRIEILAGGGVNAATAPALLAETGCRQLHAGASVGRRDPSTTAGAAAAFNDLPRLHRGEYRAADPAKVRALVQAFD